MDKNAMKKALAETVKKANRLAADLFTINEELAGYGIRPILPKAPKKVDTSLLTDTIRETVTKALEKESLTLKGLKAAIIKGDKYYDDNQLNKIRAALEEEGLIKVTDKADGLKSRVELVEA